MNGDLNKYEKLCKKLNNYLCNKHYAQYMFLKMQPLADEATISCQLLKILLSEGRHILAVLFGIALLKQFGAKITNFIC